MDAAALLRTAADRLAALSDRTTPGDWQVTGLLASRPEVVAMATDGSRQHVAEARAGTGDWIAALSPAVAGPLAAALRAASTGTVRDGDPLVDLARALLARPTLGAGTGPPAGPAH